MPVETDPASYKSAETALLREIVESAEARLQAQLTAALAADQRALVLAGFLSAAIVTLVGGAIALLLSDPPQSFLAVSALVSAAGLLIALALSVSAARPVDWNYPGTRPASWLGDIREKRDEAARLAALAADLHRKVNENANVMKTNGKLVMVALWVVATSLLSSGLALVCFLMNH